MDKLNYPVNDFVEYEFDPNRVYENTHFWSLAKRKKGKYQKNTQVTATSETEQEVFIQLLKDIIAMVEGGEQESVPFDEKEEEDIQF